MPTVSVQTDNFRRYKEWQRNGPGPYRAHPYIHRWGQMVSNNWPEAWSLTNGGAYPVVNGNTMPSTLQQRLYGKFREQAYATLQLGADFGERKQTLELIGNTLKMVRHPLQTVGAYLKKVAKKRGLRSASALVLRDSAEALLAFRYGVLPLMQTIWGVRDVLSRPYPRHSIRVRASHPEQFIFTVTNPTTTYRQENSTWIRSDGSMGAFAEISQPIAFAMDQVGLINPLSVVWELVPFSFIVDWFLPIGTYISSLSDFAGVKFTEAYQTVRSFVHSKRERPIQKKLAIDKAFSVNRILKLPSLPGLSTVNFKWKQSKVHIQNAIALIVAQKKSFVPSHLPYTE